MTMSGGAARHGHRAAARARYHTFSRHCEGPAIKPCIKRCSDLRLIDCKTNTVSNAVKEDEHGKDFGIDGAIDEVEMMSGRYQDASGRWVVIKLPCFLRNGQHLSSNGSDGMVVCQNLRPLSCPTCFPSFRADLGLPCNQLWANIL